MTTISRIPIKSLPSNKKLFCACLFVVVVSELWDQQCVRLRVNVKSDNCGENAECSGKGICFSNASMVSNQKIYFLLNYFGLYVRKLHLSLCNIQNFIVIPLDKFISSGLYFVDCIFSGCIMMKSL